MTTDTKAFQRTLGRSNLQVSAMGLGCWAIGGTWYWLDGQGGWGDIDDEESIRAIIVGSITALTSLIPLQTMAQVIANGFWHERWLENAIKWSSRQNLVST